MLLKNGIELKNILAYNHAESFCKALGKSICFYIVSYKAIQSSLLWLYFPKISHRG